LALLREGKFIEAMTDYLDDDVRLYEGNNEAKVGKSFCIIEEEKLLKTVTSFGGYKVLNGKMVKSLAKDITTPNLGLIKLGS
jgi:hypothetical protein